jgi:hypothetical protein
MGLLAKLATAEDWRNVPEQSPFAGKDFRLRPAVGNSDDLQRIIKIPRRPPVDLEGGNTREAIVTIMTERLSRGPRSNCACQTIAPGRPCITTLLPVQAWALYEAPLVGGLLAPVGTGGGKTGLGILMAMVMKSKRAVLLIPPGLRDQLARDYLLWREHFHVPSIVFERGQGHINRGAPVVHVVPYSRFSRHESTELLEQLKPDLVIADEAHRLKDKKTTTTGRVLRYLGANESTRLTCWSGTFTSKSIKDYAHLAAFALRENSPLPLEPNVVEEWSTALDPSDFPAPSGSLDALRGPSENLYQGFQRRLKQTRGVVATDEGACKASLYIHKRKTPEIPEKIQQLITDLRDTWVRPDGEELITALDVSACAKQLALGFFYRWKFPRGESVEVIERWFAARKAWNKEVREVLKNPQPHLDSPMLCENAAKRAIDGYTGPLPVWESETYAEWLAVKNTVYHEQDTVWVDDFMARDAVEFGRKSKGVIWYEYGAFGRKVEELSGFPRYGGGDIAAKAILEERGATSIVASIKAHGEGRDGLQYHFNTQLFTSQPSNGKTSEQLLARLHRPNQAEDEVHTYLYLHTPEMEDALDSARRDAAYIEGTLGTRQKLLSCAFTF